MAAPLLQSPDCEPPPWHALPGVEILTRQESNPRGLEAEEAALRLEQHGPNVLETARGTSAGRIFLRQFSDVLVVLLFVAAVVSFAIGETLDGSAILAILLVNALFGFVQEWRAERALLALSQLLPRKCKVQRDGASSEIDAAELVPGDIVSIEPGDRIPGDLRWLSGIDLKIDEASLTGESLPVSKDPRPVGEETPLAERSSMGWMGTVGTRGRGQGVVVATGMRTQFGRIAELTGSVEHDPTPLQLRLVVLGRQLAVIAVIASALVGTLGWLFGAPPLEMFMTAVSLAVAVVPEGLPAVVTVTLALGTRAMTKKRALPRRLQVTETLGSATTILTDKTGTLTAGDMTVTSVCTAEHEFQVEGSGLTPEGRIRCGEKTVQATLESPLGELIETGLVCNDSDIRFEEGQWVRVGEPTEAALVVLAKKSRISFRALERSGECPFDSTRKRMSVVISDGTERIVHCKGAPEVLLDRCDRVRREDGIHEWSTDDREHARQAFHNLASHGMRTLALARRTLGANDSIDTDAIEKNLVFLGVVGILDPPRPEVPAALARARDAGLEVRMVTGDAPETALAVAKSIGLVVDRALTGPEIEGLDDKALLRELENPVVFARTTPEHKLRLVRILKGTGRVVAMTGDGVNDAPALREADIGVAMGIRGTDVAREASDLVLTDDNFNSIIAAVEEGRREFDNIRKFVRYLLSSNIGETVAILGTILLRAPLILLPVQILWINVVTDAVTAIALGLEPPESDLMRRPPLARREPILDRAGKISVGLLGASIGLITLGLFLTRVGSGSPAEIIHAQSVAFTAMVVLEQVNIFNHRALRTPLSSIGLFSNPWLLVALFGTSALHLAAIYTPFLQELLHTTPLGRNDWLWILAFAIPLFAIPESLKILHCKGQR